MIIHIQLFGGGGGTSWGSGRIKEVTHPNARARGHREYTIDKYRFRYDPPRNKDEEHYHLENPDKTSDEDYYLDKNGKPAKRHTDEAGLTKKELEELLRKLLKRK